MPSKQSVQDSDVRFAFAMGIIIGLGYGAASAATAIGIIWLAVK